MMEEYILITGASSGIGEATAIELSEEHRIILSGRNIEKLKEVQNKCHCPQKHLLWRCDLDKDRLQVYTSLNSFPYPRAIGTCIPLRVLICAVLKWSTCGIETM